MEVVNVDVGVVSCSHSLAVGNANGDAVAGCLLVVARAVSTEAMA